MAVLTASPGEVEAATVREWMERGEALVVDVREPDEHARERIEGAVLMPLSRFNAAALPRPDGRRVVFHCKGGRRAAEAVARARSAGIAECLNLKGGIEGWKSAGLPVEFNARVPISIMRQVQITAGSMVLMGSVLAWLVSPWFLVLSGFFGAGLVFAGVSGTCGLAAVLGAMPWNRGMRCEASCAARR
jgi:rhodanese-related sulfurtransferase